MFELEITPEQAGWAFCGLRVLQGEAAFDSGEDELIVLPLEGGAEVSVDGESFTLRGRDGVFDGPTDFVYAPCDARVEIAASARDQETQASYLIFREQFDLDKPIFLNTRFALSTDEVRRDLQVVAETVSASIAERIAAQDRLSDLGNYAVPHLMKVLEAADAEGQTVLRDTAVYFLRQAAPRQVSKLQ